MANLLYWFLLLVPVTLALHIGMPSAHILVFALSAVCMIPLAYLLSEATENLSARTGPAIGALLGITFGNAGELLIGYFALRKGLQAVVKASITGSILVNLLLTLGISMVAAGVRRKTLKFNALAARTQATTLALAAVSLALPAAYHWLGGRLASRNEADLSSEFALVLIATYALSLLFTLRTHRHLLTAEEHSHAEGEGEPWPAKRSLFLLLASAVFVGWMSEVLVGSVETASRSLGLTELFAGLVIVAIAGNAAESTSAVRAAAKGQMDLSVGIGIGSSIQIALFVGPALVLISHFVAAQPMNLVFTPAELLALLFTIGITGQIAGDGDSNWFEGVQLLAVYFMLAVMFYFLPEA